MVKFGMGGGGKVDGGCFTNGRRRDSSFLHLYMNQLIIKLYFGSFIPMVIF